MRRQFIILPWRSSKYYFTSDETPWYEDCDSIQKVVIESDVTAIGECAFGDCENLTSIKIPAAVKKIGDEIFRECLSLEKIFFIPPVPT